MSVVDESSPNPATTPPKEDAGADTQRRFRHQACYTALLSLSLLDDGGPIAELYCEHHEDVILKLKSARFKAIQLKTRLVGGVPFKTTDAEIVGALCKFVSLEAKFPGVFESYLIASNVGFWHERKNGSNLEFVVSELRASSDKSAKTLVAKILKADSDTPRSTVVAVLAKVETVVTPGLDDVELKLRDQLARKTEFRGRRYDELETAADALRARISEASSLAGLNFFKANDYICEIVLP